MSNPNQDIVHRLLHWAYTICTFNKAQVARDAAAEIERLRAELAAAKTRIDELVKALGNIAQMKDEPFSRDYAKDVLEGKVKP